jgi:hypothetical protein
MVSKTQERNLRKLAKYLESLPEDYGHFHMQIYAEHKGECNGIGDPESAAALEPQKFFENCGTIACAAGHGPAAGIPFAKSDFYRYQDGDKIPSWPRYVRRAFTDEESDVWHFLFASIWASYDNHHWSAAARIRYYLANGVPHGYFYNKSVYENYRKKTRK